MDFCHIAPIPHLNLVEGRPVHLTLAHLTETSPEYVEFYLKQKEQYPNTVIIQDNSAFEMYKQGRNMYPADRLIEMGKQINADYLVMTDFPGEPASKTRQMAELLAPQMHDAGFGTFYCPQSEIGNKQELIEEFAWALQSPLIDYIGVSILAIPNAYGVERGNKLQRFVSRFMFINELNKYLSTNFKTDVADLQYRNDKKIHFLGMVDGPKEIDLVKNCWIRIDTWDSSAAVWAGLNGVAFDGSPTGLVEGKFEKEVDFNFQTTDSDKIALAQTNMRLIDELSRWL